MRTRAALTVGLALLAMAAATAIRAEPLVAPLAAGALASAVVVRRFPSAALIAAFALTGTYGTLEAFTPLEGGPALDVLLAGLWAVAAFGYLAGGRREAVRLWPGAAVLAVYVAVTLVQSLAAPDLRQGLRAFHASAWYMAAALLVAYTPWTATARRQLRRGIVCVGAAVGAYGAMRLLAGAADAEVSQALSYPANAGYRRGGELPLIGSLTSPKELAAWCALVLPFLFASSLGERGRWRWMAAAACGLLALSLFGTEARLGLVAAVLGLAVVLVVHQLGAGGRGARLGTAFAAVTSTAVALAAAFALVVGDDPEAKERYRALSAPSTIYSYEERMARWADAMRVVRERPAGLGVGFAGGTSRGGSRQFRTDFNPQLDSSYVKIAIEQGWLIVVFLAAIGLLLGGLARTAVSLADGSRSMAGAGAVGAGVAFAVLMYGGLFVEGLVALAAWILIGLGIAELLAPEGRRQTEKVVRP